MLWALCSSSSCPEFGNIILRRILSVLQLCLWKGQGTDVERVAFKVVVGVWWAEERGMVQGRLSALVLGFNLSLSDLFYKMGIIYYYVVSHRSVTLVKVEALRTPLTTSKHSVSLSLSYKWEVMVQRRLNNLPNVTLRSGWVAFKPDSNAVYPYRASILKCCGWCFWVHRVCNLLFIVVLLTSQCLTVVILFTYLFILNL